MFLLKDDVTLNYCKNKTLLYEIFKKITSKDNIKIKYKISIYKQLCNIIHKDIIVNYIENKYPNRYKKKEKKYIFKNKRTKEICLMEINYSIITIITNKNYSFLFDILNIYNKNFFICDFENNDYFLLKDIKENILIKKNHIIN